MISPDKMLRMALGQPTELSLAEMAEIQAEYGEDALMIIDDVLAYGRQYRAHLAGEF